MVKEKAANSPVREVLRRGQSQRIANAGGSSCFLVALGNEVDNRPIQAALRVVPDCELLGAPGKVDEALGRVEARHLAVGADADDCRFLGITPRLDAQDVQHAAVSLGHRVAFEPAAHVAAVPRGIVGQKIAGGPVRGVEQISVHRCG